MPVTTHGRYVESQDASRPTQSSTVRIATFAASKTPVCPTRLPQNLSEMVRWWLSFFFDLPFRLRRFTL